MAKRTYTGYMVSFAFLIVMLILLLFQNINSDSIHLSAGEIGKMLADQAGDGTACYIVWDIRLPRIPAVAVLGGTLSVSDFLFQTSFVNPIAGPFVLGISSGARLVVSLLMTSMLGKRTSVNSVTVIPAALTGAMISMGFALLISGKVKKMSALIICGVMIGYICSTITDLTITFADGVNIVSLHSWSMGSFPKISWENIRVMTGVVPLSSFLIFLVVKPINAYQLGEVYAQNTGTSIPGFRVALVLMSSAPSVYMTTFADSISLVGIAVPHLVRNLFKTARPITVIPGCFLDGAVFCPLCDLVARTVSTPTEPSTSSATTVFGASIIIYMMVRGRKGTQ